MRFFIIALALLSVVMFIKAETMTFRPLRLQATYHYDSPYANDGSVRCTGTHEIAAFFDGTEGQGCMPQAIVYQESSHCYQDYPTDNTASTLPIFKDRDGNTRCALVCAGMATGMCAHGADCMIISKKDEPVVGVCLYIKPKIELPAI